MAPERISAPVHVQQDPLARRPVVGLVHAHGDGAARLAGRDAEFLGFGKRDLKGGGGKKMLVVFVSWAVEPATPIYHGWEGQRTREGGKRELGSQNLPGLRPPNSPASIISRKHGAPTSYHRGTELVASSRKTLYFFVSSVVLPGSKRE